MGTIARFDLADLHRRFGVRYFVETGTGAGGSIEHVRTTFFGPDRIRRAWSCEIDSEMSATARQRFEDDPHINVFNQKSEDFLEMICSSLRESEPILFWLDAHFPGADQGFGGRSGFGDELNTAIRLPLERELEIISLLRPAAKDVIICDDLRIYVDGPFQHKNVPEDVRPFCPRDRNIDFVYRLMDATHDVKELYEHEGYILITPKAEHGEVQGKENADVT